MTPHPRRHGQAWTDGRRAELTELWNRRPLVPIEKIAEIMGHTRQAVQTAASRFGLPRRLTSVGAFGAGRTAALPTPPAGRQRPCITCSKTFWSDGKHNRMCSKCLSGDDADASVA